MIAAAPGRYVCRYAYWRGISLFIQQDAKNFRCISIPIQDQRSRCLFMESTILRRGTIASMIVTITNDEQRPP